MNLKKGLSRVSFSLIFVLILIGIISCGKSTLIGIPVSKDKVGKPENPGKPEKPDKKDKEDKTKEDKETPKTESSGEETMTEETLENEETQTETIQKEGIKGTDFEGVYYFKSNGFLELIANSKNQVSILSTNQKLYVNNKNNSIGLLPTLSRTNLEVIRSQIFYTVDMNFSSTTHNIQDNKNKVISGIRRVDVLLTYYGPNRLYIQYTIYKTRLSEKAGTEVVVIKNLVSH